MTERSDIAAILESFLERPEGHRCLALDSGLAALDCRARMIRLARQRIWMSSFLWRNDRSGNFLLDALAERARAGVDVRILLDHWGTMDSLDSVLPRLRRWAEQQPVQVRLFNPLVREFAPEQWQVATAPLHAGQQLNHRMHGKVALFDDRAAIVGGRNIGDEYFDLHLFRCFFDAELLVAGPSVSNLVGGFESFWENSLTVDLMDFEDAPQSSEEGSPPEDYPRDWRQFEEIVSCYCPDYADNTFEPESIDVVIDSPSVDHQSPTATADATLEFLQRSNHQLRITSPMLILEKDWLQSLGKLRQQHPGLNMSLVTNSLVSTDNLFTYAAQLAQRHQLLTDLKLRIHEILPIPNAMDEFVPSYSALREMNERSDTQPKSGFGSNRFECQQLHTTLHGKYAVADGDWLLLGSPNLDPRSLICNTELLLVIRGKSIAAHYGQIHDHWRMNRNSWSIAESGIRGYSQFWARAMLAWHRWTGGGRWPYRPCRCYAPRDSTPDEIPDPERDNFEQDYQSCGHYPGVEDSEQQVEMIFLENVSAIFRGLL